MDCIWSNRPSPEHGAPPAGLRGFLSGVRILDLSQYISGPFVSLLLADMGAEVLKVEPPRGDEMRNLGPRDGAGDAVFYGALNAGKSVVRLDLKSAADVATLWDHIVTADVLIEGFRPGVMARLGLDYPTLKARRPELIYCSISGYGPTGPLALRAGHDGNYLATSGIMDRNGQSAPAFFDPPVADMAGALFAAIAILGALHGRHASGVGSHIELGLADTLMPLQMLQIAEWGANGTVPKSGSTYLNGAAAFYQTYATADSRHVMLGPVEPKFWANFCEAAGRPDWIGRHADRMPQTNLIAELSSFFIAQTLEEVTRRFAHVECCLSPVFDLSEALTSAQVAARGLVGKSGDALQAWFPATFDGEVAPPRAALNQLDAA